MLVSFLAVGLNLLFNWLFTFRLGWGHRGLAFSTACVATFNFLFLYALMRRRLGGLESGHMLRALLKIFAAGAALCAVCAAGSHWLLAGWAAQAFWSKTVALVVTICVAAGVFIACGMLLGIEELADLFAALKRRLRRAA